MNGHREKPAREVGQIAGDSPGLSGALRAARAYEELNRRVAPVLPEGTRGRIRIACVEDDCLVLAAASPVWASRARTMAGTMLERAAALWPQPLNRWRVIVAPGIDSRESGETPGGAGSQGCSEAP